MNKDLFAKNGKLEDLYGQTVVKYVREKYTLNDELAIQRQRDDKVEAFNEYNTFVEDCKARAYREVYGENKEV